MCSYGGRNLPEVSISLSCREILLRTYFLMAQGLEKLRISMTKLLLKLNTDVTNLNVSAGHECKKCNFKSDDETTVLFENLSLLKRGCAVKRRCRKFTSQGDFESHQVC